MYSRTIVDETFRPKAQGLTDKAIAAQCGRRIVLEPWQQQIVDGQPEAFIRGLMHSDGCRLINRIRTKLPQGGERTYEYPRYQFVNTSKDIVDLPTDALDGLDIAWKSRIRKREPRYRDATVVSVSRRDAVARMDSFVGPKD